jgi:hypothetical protein
MTTKNKKKNNNTIQMEQRKAQISNDIHKKVLRFLKVFNAYDLYMQLPQSEHKFVKKNQFKTVAVKAEKDSGISDSILLEVKKELLNYLQSTKITFDGIEDNFTMHDLLTAGQTLWNITRFTKNNEIWKAIFEKILPLKKYFEECEETLHINIVLKFLHDFVNKFSSVDKYFLWVTWKMDLKETQFLHIYTLHRQVCTRKNMVIDNKSRPVYRVGIAIDYSGVQWASVSGQKLSPFINNVEIDREYPVYIQSHALERTEERLYPIPQYQKVIFSSIRQCEISKSTGGNLFIAVLLAECKLGYLLTDFTGDELIIRSFLFITNNGTPEGHAFNEKLRVETYSKKYFRLDSLPIFMVTDICIDPFFSSVLNECGCDGLVKLKKYINITRDDKFSEKLRRVLDLEEKEF